MTKADIVKKISEETGVDTEAVLLVVDSLMQNIKNRVSGGDTVYFRGFGSFGRKLRKQKTGRNISAETPVIIPAHHIPHFKPSIEFKQSVKNNDED